VNALAGLLHIRWTYLIIGAIVIAAGVGVYATDHPATPVEVDGTIAGYTEYTQNGVYDRNQLKLANDSNTYTLDKTTFHPALPDSVYKDGKVSIWVENGTTTVIAMTLYDENDGNPVKYTTDQYTNPSPVHLGGQTLAIMVGVVAVLGLWLMLVLARRPAVAPAAGGVTPPVA
jgi:hypothetical protein